MRPQGATLEATELAEPASSERPLSIVIRRVVKAGQQARFEAAVRAFTPVSVRFAGHLGVHVVAPPTEGHEYAVILSFGSEAAWREFQVWDCYRSWLEHLRLLLADDPAVEEVTGLEIGFRMLGELAFVLKSRWKMAIVTWVGVCLTVGILNVVLRPLVVGWTWWTTLLGFNAVVVAALTWVVMPVLSRMTRGWFR